MKEFNKITYKNYALRIRKDNTRVINQLDKQPNKTAYIVKLIENDINK